MQLTTLSVLLFAIAFAAYHAGRDRAHRMSGGAGFVHSRPRYHGYFVMIRSIAPALLVVLAWLILEPTVLHGRVLEDMPDAWRTLPAGELAFRLDAVGRMADSPDSLGAGDAELTRFVEQVRGQRLRSRTLLAWVALLSALLSGALALRRVAPKFRARTRVEATLTRILIAASGIALLTTVGIVLSVVFEAARFFAEVPVFDFFFGTTWSPGTAIRADQIGSTGQFGAVPLFVGTLLVTAIAMLVAVPVGLFAAVYFSEYASRRIRSVAKPLVEVLAGIPTVVYGFFAVLVVAPLVQSLGTAVGISIAAESALTAGLVMGVMIIPLISALSDDALSAVPIATREAAIALGATRSEAMLGVIMPAAMPGILGGIMLAVSRAIGETMIVLMAASLAANLTANPFAAVTTVTVQIVSLLVGDQEFDSARTLAAFALGLVLFLVTLALNVLGLGIVRRYRSQYV